MFVPTIKYKRVNEISVKEDTKEERKSPANNTIDTAVAAVEEKEKTATDTPEPATSSNNTGSAAPDDDAEPTIEVDPSDKERILVTLTSGKQYTADRYCPHAGADLSYLGEVAEDEYPPEIGPILMCTLHYWEFALEKAGRSGGGWATLNACPVPADQCPAGENNKKLDW
ncbi:hypothetical protein BDB00DRAFT_947187 [Zychaea mexicana]|uniref:uncharacterized protein n=1 Tax=Zychaea mexicana TaxID=64656 RepID=UPI0022FE7492|nr:uncharacterized protein BDB00DRAFT_947187 [Zychaea mexicana]KAI9489814.1 hypothetical protein BDB00DRAFT_947187 [Zychaea mexicana]